MVIAPLRLEQFTQQHSLSATHRSTLCNTSPPLPQIIVLFSLVHNPHLTNHLNREHVFPVAPTPILAMLPAESPRCRGLDDFFQPFFLLHPPRLVYPRGTEWWDDDEQFSPFYQPDGRPTHRLNISHFRILRRKSNSASCRVTIARHTDTAGIFCVKIFDRASSASISRAMSEIRAYKRIVEYPDSPSLAEAQAVFRDSESLYIIMVGLILHQSSSTHAPATV